MIDKTTSKQQRLAVYMLNKKHEKYGFTSLETLSSWNDKVNKFNDLNFVFKKTLKITNYNIYKVLLFKIKLCK